jgi:hypothetical protein
MRSAKAHAFFLQPLWYRYYQVLYLQYSRLDKTGYKRAETAPKKGKLRKTRCFEKQTSFTYGDTIFGLERS